MAFANNGQGPHFASFSSDLSSPQWAVFKISHKAFNVKMACKSESSMSHSFTEVGMLPKDISVPFYTSNPHRAPQCGEARSQGWPKPWECLETGFPFHPARSMAMCSRGAGRSWGVLALSSLRVGISARL